jgi:hypothetical protein
VAATTSTTTMPRNRLAVAAVIGAVSWAAAACAHPQPGLADLQVVDRETGRVLPLWRHGGHLYVAGKPGDRYGLRVTNRTGGRILAVMSVDGVNVLSGETADWGQRGYIFDPYETYDVTGWRKSDTEVAAFTFSAQSQSYAARTGRPADVGVIGIAVFKEKVEPPPPEPSAVISGKSASPRLAPRAPAAAAPSPPPAAQEGSLVSELAVTGERKANGTAGADEKLGTGHGEREWSVTTVEPFERATRYPQFTLQIEYDTYAHLAAQGIISPDDKERPHPRPFPSNPDDRGYVPDPPDDP